MARSSFNAIASWTELHLRTDSFGPTEALGVVTGWPEANGGRTSLPTGPGGTYAADPLGDGSGPGALLDPATSTGGMDSGVSVAGGTDFTAWALVRQDANAALFYAFIGDDNLDCSLYAEAGDLYLFVNGGTLYLGPNVPGTIYRVIWTRTGTTNEVYLSGLSVGTRTGNETIGFEFGSNDTGNNELDGALLAYGILAGTALSGADITALDAAIAQEQAGIGDGSGTDEFLAMELGHNF